MSDLVRNPEDRNGAHISCDIFETCVYNAMYVFPSPEHIASVIAAMLRNCQATQRQRLLNKFTENDHEKVGQHYYLVF